MVIIKILFCFLHLVFAGQESPYYISTNVSIPTSLASGIRFNGPLPPVIHSILYVPKDDRPTHSVMIILPSSAGIREDREIYYAIEFAKAGIASLVVDSTGSRNVTTLKYDQMQITTSDFEMDAFIANKFLRQDPRFQRSKIGVMGVSKGGTTSQFLAMKIRRKWRQTENFKFDAYAMLSPSCFQYHENSTTDNKPMFFMLAEFDDGSSPQDCMVVINQIMNAGNAFVRYKVYKGAYHSWETLGKVYYEKNNMLMNSCYYTWNNAGDIIPVSTGTAMSPRDWPKWALQTCMRRGLTTGGGTPELKREATANLIDFLNESGFNGRADIGWLEQTSPWVINKCLPQRGPASLYPQLELRSLLHF